MSGAETREAATVRARLHLLNADWHAEDVRARFGSLSIEYAIAKEVRRLAEAELLAAYRAELAADASAGRGRAP